MAYTELTVQPIAAAGITPSYASATLTDGDMYRNTGREFIHIVNGGGGACTVTLPTPRQVQGLDVEDPTVVVGAGAEAMIGPLDPTTYNQAAGQTDAGKTYIEYSTVTSVTVGVFRAA